MVTPGVHDGAPVGTLQLAPTVPPTLVQSLPLQHRFGRGFVCGVHVRLGAQPPVESQRQPWVPTMHVVGAPAPAPGLWGASNMTGPSAVAPLPLLLPQLASTSVSAVSAATRTLFDMVPPSRKYQ